MPRKQGRTHDAFLDPWAAKLNSSPQLAKLTLANILSGDTCPPISCADFEAYLTYKEHSVENLQFVVWFQDYRKRYFAISQMSRALSRESPLFQFAAPSYASTERRAAQSQNNPVLLSKNSDMFLAGPPTSEIDSPSLFSRTDTLPVSLTRITTEDSGNFLMGKEQTRCRDESLKTECMRIVATFLLPKSKKELTLDAIVRDTAIRNLEHSTHPDVFLPIYEEMYDMLENMSLPKFLAYATANINYPLQLMWYALGFLELLIGIAVAVSLIACLPTPPQLHRVWRLFSVPFTVFGIMTIYSAWRGFCSRVWRRGGAQMRVWELQEMDEESQTFYDDVLSPSLAPSSRKSGGDNPFMLWDEPGCDITLPTAVAPKPSGFRNIYAIKLSCFRFATWRKKNLDINSDSATEIELQKFVQPPLFGPEKVVCDPRIQAIHQKIWNDILHVGFWVFMIYTLLILSVPGPRR